MCIYACIYIYVYMCVYIYICTQCFKGLRLHLVIFQIGPKT